MQITLPEYGGARSLIKRSWASPFGKGEGVMKSFRCTKYSTRVWVRSIEVKKQQGQDRLCIKEQIKMKLFKRKQEQGGKVGCSEWL